MRLRELVSDGAARLPRNLATVAILLVVNPAAQAARWDLDNGWVVNFDSLVSLGAALRTSKTNCSFVGNDNGGCVGDTATPLQKSDPASFSASVDGLRLNQDDGNLNYKRGQLVSANAQWVPELAVRANDGWSGLIRGALNYDAAITHTKRTDLDPDAESFSESNPRLLDAYVTKDLDVLGRPTRLRVGTQVISWGEDLYILGGVNNVNPIYLPGAHSAGTPLKTLFLPAPMVSLNTAVLDGLSVGAFYQWEWTGFEFDAPGTYFSTSDVLSELARDVPSGAPWTSARLAELDSMTLGEWLVQQGIKPQDRVGWDLSALLTGGSSPAMVGLLHFLANINSGDSDFHRIEEIKNSAQETWFVGGSQSLSMKMTASLGDKLRLSCPVRRITDWNTDLVRLHTDRGEIRARRVVMALHPALCNRIEFSPALPEPRAALQRDWPAFAPLRKTAMVYAKPFWRERGLNGQVLQFGGPVMWSWDNSPANGKIGVLSAFVHAGQLPSDPQQARQMLTPIYARALGDEALEPLSFHDHDWATADEWAQTCLPAVPAGFWSKHGEGLRKPCGNLIWSGTETAERWVGYMDGAVSAGHRSARQALFALHSA